MDENELKHYGVLGMRWGVRKANKNLKRYQRKNEKAQKHLDKMTEKLTSADKHNRLSRSKTENFISRENHKDWAVYKSDTAGYHNAQSKRYQVLKTLRRF